MTSYRIHFLSYFAQNFLSVACVIVFENEFKVGLIRKLFKIQGNDVQDDIMNYIFCFVWT